MAAVIVLRVYAMTAWYAFLVLDRLLGWEQPRWLRLR